MDNENKPIMETEPFDYKDDNGDMKMKLNRSNDDNKKKIIMYVVIGVVVLILILVMIYIVLGNKKIPEPTTAFIPYNVAPPKLNFAFSVSELIVFPLSNRSYHLTLVLLI